MATQDMDDVISSLKNITSAIEDLTENQVEISTAIEKANEKLASIDSWKENVTTVIQQNSERIDTVARVLELIATKLSAPFPAGTPAFNPTLTASGSLLQTPSPQTGPTVPVVGDLKAVLIEGLKDYDKIPNKEEFFTKLTGFMSSKDSLKTIVQGVTVEKMKIAGFRSRVAELISHA